MEPGSQRGSNPGVLWLPLVPTLLLAGLSFLPRIAGSPKLAASFWIASGVLLVWQIVLAIRTTRAGRRPELVFVASKAHWVQALVQLGVYAYWGWYWRQVYDQAWLILAQIVFSYAFDMLLSWSKRETWVLGFGPFPIVLSTNLFLWFRDDWFLLQFLMVAVGFLGKGMFKWSRGGRRTHIFNPSALSLSVFSLALIATHSTPITWGEEIATTLFYPPHIYLAIFLLGLVVQLLFPVVLVTLVAAVTVYLTSALYLDVTGVYFFIDSHIPIAVFLGLHLLVTDPSTSPRTDLGRVLFGALYGVGVVALYAVLESGGAPTFYDKLLCVPLLNLSVRELDRFAARLVPRGRQRRRVRSGPSGLWARLGYVSLWSACFAGMFASGALRDEHEGHTLPFWQRACDQALRNGCRNLVAMESTYCALGSGWACNELGIHLSAGPSVAGDAMRARGSFAEACKLGFEPGCVNALGPAPGGALRAPPRLIDWFFLLQGGKGALPDSTVAIDLYAEACDQGWPIGCRAVGQSYLEGRGVPVDHAAAADGFRRACDAGEAASCANLGLMYRKGDGVPRDDARAVGLLESACDLGMPQACQWLGELRP